MDYAFEGPVEITGDGPYGLLDNNGQVAPDLTARKGDRGSYIGIVRGDEGWHFIAVDRQGERYIVPLHEDWFTATQ